jgi:hypothetical protein
MKRLLLTLAVSVFGVVLGSQAAAAERGEPKPLVPMGMAAVIGGGVAGFTASDAVDMTNPAGAWTARIIVGTRTPVGFEAAYVGTAQDITALNLDSKSILLSSAVEGLVRVNILTGRWQPYVFGGLAYKHYDLVNSDFNTSSVLNSDAVGEVPLGGGIAFRYDGFVADARLAFNPAFESDLIPTIGGEKIDLHTWNLNLKVGWEF